MRKRLITHTEDIEVFVGPDCHVVINQPVGGEDNHMVIIDPDNIPIPLLIEHLASARDEAMECRRKPRAAG